MWATAQKRHKWRDVEGQSVGVKPHSLQLTEEIWSTVAPLTTTFTTSSWCVTAKLLCGFLNPKSLQCAPCCYSGKLSCQPKAAAHFRDDQCESPRFINAPICTLLGSAGSDTSLLLFPQRTRRKGLCNMLLGWISYLSFSLKILNCPQLILSWRVTTVKIILLSFSGLY